MTAPWAMGLAVALGAAALAFSLDTHAAPTTLPDRLSDKAFWHLVTSMSEPGGYFRSDNFVSNELSFQQIVPALARLAPPGGVYLGVGPEQNFTYIVALKPRIAFIFDIRRQNMLEHLLYKALIEQADVERLFRALVQRLAERDPARLSAPFQVAELYQQILPYRTNRARLGFDTNQDYETAGLGLLAGVVLGTRGGRFPVAPPPPGPPPLPLPIPQPPTAGAMPRFPARTLTPPPRGSRR